MRFNSTIKDKIGICIDCGASAGEKTLISKRCPIHYSIFRAKVNRDKESIKVQIRSLNTPDQEVSVLKQMWFNTRRKEMTGYCSNCGGTSCKNDDSNFRSSIAHILPKRHFKSVQFHKLNWIELCHFGNCCHTNFDNLGSDNWDTMKCWNEIVEKFKVLYPLTLPEERQFIPKILQQFT